MRSRLLLFASICTFNTALWAQTVPHSTHAADQVVQGPCYIFATTAALESRALQNPANNLTASNANFNEWQSYSTCALGGRIWGGLEMIKATLNQAKTNGVSPGDHANPIFDNCPNPNDPKTPCIADFSCVNLNTSWCEEDKMYLPIQLNTSCNDADVSSNRTYTIDGGGDFDYKLLPDANGDLYKREPVISVTSITNLLSSGHGVIAYFSGWKNTAIDHAVYIYKYAGGFFYYKDSWPGAATAEGKISSLSTCYNLFYITGTIVPNSSGNNTSIPCDYDIQGDGVVAATGTTTYTLS
ncbi:MAG TPA: hypothetical protein DCE41_37665 [Cytophagales bacterium]|nr:hypothetical protein [Cytophagales bacterium]